MVFLSKTYFMRKIQKSNYGITSKTEEKKDNDDYRFSCNRLVFKFI